MEDQHELSMLLPDLDVLDCNTSSNGNNKNKKTHVRTHSGIPMGTKPSPTNQQQPTTNCKFKSWSKNGSLIERQSSFQPKLECKSRFLCFFPHK